MSWEPTVECRGCGDSLDVYQDYEHRFCECCEELRNTTETCGDCRKTKTGLEGDWVEIKYEDKWQCHDCQAKEEANIDRGDAMASVTEDMSKATMLAACVLIGALRRSIDVGTESHPNHRPTYFPLILHGRVHGRSASQTRVRDLFRRQRSYVSGPFWRYPGGYFYGFRLARKQAADIMRQEDE